MLFESLTEKAIKGSLDVATDIEQPESVFRARKVVEYYRSAAKQQDDLLEQHAALHQKKDRWTATPKAVYNLTSAVAKTLCTLYGDPVVYRWEDDALGARAGELFGRISGWAGVMRDIDTYTMLTDLIAARPIWRDDLDNPVKVALYLPDQIAYTMQPEDMTEAQELMFMWEMGQGDNVTTVQHIWSDEKFVEVVDGEAVPDPERKGFSNPYQVIPVTLFRNGEPRWEFYGEPASDLTIANLTLNGQTTMLNLMALKQAFSTLMAVGAPEGWVPTVGIDSFISVTNPPGSTGAGAEYLQPKADIMGVVSAINTCLAMFFASRRIPESAIIAKQAGDSGVALVAQAAALVDYRKERISIFRPLEQDLIRKTLKVMEYHETGKLVDFPAPNITYMELKKAMSVEERDEWDWRISHGVASELDLYRALNPGLTDEQSEELYKENLAERHKVMAQGVAQGLEGEGEEEAEIEPPAIEGGEVEDVAKTAMNGAQVTALQGIVQSVAEGKLPREAAKNLILMAFPSLDYALVTEMLDAIPEGSVEPEPAQPPPPQVENEPLVSGEATGLEK